MTMDPVPAGAVVEHADPTTVRGRFRLERLIEGATPESVFRVWTDEALQRRWNRLPGRETRRELELAVGGVHVIESELTGTGVTERVLQRGTFLALDPAQHVAFAYAAIVDGLPRWASLVDIRLDRHDEGCRVTWSEQFLLTAFIGDGAQDLAHLVGATRLRLTGLAVVATEPP